MTAGVPPNSCVEGLTKRDLGVAAFCYTDEASSTGLRSPSVDAALAVVLRWRAEDVQQWQHANARSSCQYKCHDLLCPFISRLDKVTMNPASPAVKHAGASRKWSRSQAWQIRLAVVSDLDPCTARISGIIQKSSEYPATQRCNTVVNGR
ncbi:hypothetical protein M8818_004076 [Zalaria obscura]|uniref:Uncharacterized protein n=1 Tax=Zalaria obscura TaxID=2024903 RepID=A0ACC3SFX7_9PEZI